MTEKDVNAIKNLKSSVDKILTFTKDIKDGADLDENLIVFDAVKMNLMVIRDMVSIISDETKTQFPDVNWEQVEVFNKNVINNYLGINIDYVWRICSVHMPVFQEQLSQVEV